MMNNQILAPCESAGASLRSQATPPYHLLVVEDEYLLRELNTVALLRSGYEVDAAEDGVAAREALKANHYDLMITDNNMPRLTGVGLLQKLHSARIELPVILASGNFPTQEFAASPWLQPAATLLKPYTAEEMLITVKKVLCEAGSTAAVPPFGVASLMP